MYIHSKVHPSWKAVDDAALGLIYGAILVLSMLMAVEEASASPARPGLVLLGSVLAVTAAKAFSELLAHALRTHERILTRKALTAAWQRSHQMLTVANVPTVLVLAAGLGWIDFSLAVSISQAFCVAILAALGARVGWAIKPRSWLPVGAAAFVGGIGLALAVLKYAIHG